MFAVFGVQQFLHFRHYLIMRNQGAAVIQRFLYLGTKPALISLGLFGRGKFGFDG